MLYGQFARIADADDFFRRVMAKHKGGKRYRGRNRLKVPRRDRDDQSPSLAASNPFECINHRPGMPTKNQLPSRHDRLKYPPNEGKQIVGQHRIDKLSLERGTCGANAIRSFRAAHLPFLRLRREGALCSTISAMMLSSAADSLATSVPGWFGSNSPIS